jgi:hypothetical protein
LLDERSAVERARVEHQLSCRGCAPTCDDGSCQVRERVRQPRVAVLVNDGRPRCIVYGRAVGVPEDLERLRPTRRGREHRGARWTT